MENLEIGHRYEIHSYKHDGKIHRAWDEAVLLEIHEDYLIFGNDKTKVTESDGRSWRTKEPAIIYFFKNSWFNIIGQYKKDGIYYYCNIATPYIIEENTIKYIDYDLDLRVFPDGSFKVLDRGEYEYHKNLMHYSDDLDYVLKGELTNLINMAREKELAFVPYTVERYYEIYKKYKLKSQNK
jgi:protein associated with RNAse G/E